MAIIYLHGFAGAGPGSVKANMLQKHFAQERVLAPNLPVNPAEVVAEINQLVRDLAEQGEKKILFVGSSLGGFYAWYFSAAMDCPAFLINPSTDAGNSLRRRVGSSTNMVTGQTFEWKDDYSTYLDGLREFAVKQCDLRHLRCAVALDDVVIDPQQTVEFFKNSPAKVEIFEVGGHRFEQGERLLPAIEQLYATIKKCNDLDI